MKRMTRNGYVFTGAAAAALLVVGGVAFAFWTSSGSATGSADVTSAVDGLVLTATPVSGLYPGITPQAVEVSLQNTNDFPVTVSDVAVSVASTSPSSCLAADFVVDGSAYAGEVVPANTTVTAQPATITMLNTSANQDACKGASISLAFSAS